MRVKQPLERPPDEWRLLRALVADHVARAPDPVDDRVGRSLTALGTVLQDGNAERVVAHVRRELGSTPDPGTADVLRGHLALALVARSAEVRAVTDDGGLAIRTRRQAAECHALADEVLALRPDPGLVALALDLRGRAEEAERWRWVEPGVGQTAVVALAVLVLPFVGGAVGSAGVTAAGVAVGAALVFGFVLAHRRRGWALDTRSVRRPGL
ncbi:hypothetical protein [Saccharothrix yanglingensis]|uniref:Uncharacterized protein n=1 Tax=Saccharothrix yanglingensis TaxID=659496 RepID=A0ABU0X2T6_9PSEU|nr:hypothetical protein [Saccharothrix yanglingensis]MDQ2586053.1 hypothetical protein [Saccharothrix yanglingensis]